jgi:hypothetical protein
LFRNKKGELEMENEMVKRDELDIAVSDIDKMSKLSRALMATKHYTKMGEAGVFAIVMKARSLGLNPMEALNGGMYYLDGKVEMSSTLMAKLIRQKGHSVTKARESNDEICILHGKRADNGDTWSSSFSMKDAVRAGLSNKDNWKKYPGAMCYNRALSLLARQLFPDVIGNSYVEGEITDSAPVGTPVEMLTVEATGEVVETGIITKDQAEKLESLIGTDDEFRGLLMGFLNKKFGVSTLDQIPSDHVEMIMHRTEERAKQREEKKALESQPASVAQSVLKQMVCS